MKTYKKIKNIRKKIDAIDRKIAKLCGMRADLSKNILEIKSSENITKFDKHRESVICKNYLSYLSKKSRKKNIKIFVSSLLQLNKKYNK